ncbi:cytochrome b [Vibrio rhizosphaerae]|uniref:Cytochrome b n=1 Tax=Vibrio rhizosphaerae TaxID=398736 RepID=A0ABU4IWM7_9VIBR|nr:cytochrome b [Vibrio rhizosphaerae]MDW6093770.1 cytochrome b [Vibrio rhizosphaerae]
MEIPRYFKLKYSKSIRTIHWLSATIVIGLLALGIYMTPYDEANAAFADNLYFWHKSFGVLFFIIVLVRIFVRRRSKLPPLPDGISKTERVIVNLAHKLFYILMVAIPLLGYIQSSSYEYSDGVHFFFFDLPELLPKNQAVYEVANTLHKWLSFVLIGLITLHILGALRHRLFDRKNDVLKRIL